MAYTIVSGDAVGEWVAHETERMYFPQKSEAIGIERHGRLVAGIILEDWNFKSVVCHMAIRGRIAPEYLWSVANYIFNMLGVHKIIAPIASENERMMIL